METKKAQNNPYGSKLFEDDSHKDFKIFVQDQEFKVHKCILSVASPVLAVMVKSQMLEGHSGQMSIVDFSPKTVQESLNFMYKGGCTEKSCKNAECLTEMLNFGHKYDVEELQDYCIEQIDKNKACFGQEQRRDFIKNAVKLDSDRILDSILAVFGSSGTGAFKFNNYLVPSSELNICSPTSTSTATSAHIGSSNVRSFSTLAALLGRSRMLSTFLSSGQQVQSSSVGSTNTTGTNPLENEDTLSYVQDPAGVQENIDDSDEESDESDNDTDTDLEQEIDVSDDEEIGHSEQEVEENDIEISVSEEENVEIEAEQSEDDKSEFGDEISELEVDVSDQEVDNSDLEIGSQSDQEIVEVDDSDVEIGGKSDQEMAEVDNSDVEIGHSDQEIAEVDNSDVEISGQSDQEIDQEIEDSDVEIDSKSDQEIAEKVDDSGSGSESEKGKGADTEPETDLESELNDLSDLSDDLVW